MVLALAAWTSVGCSSDPYFDVVADLQEDLVETLDELMSDFERNADQCSRAIFSSTACDRAVDDVIDMRNETRSAYITAEGLDPPSEAATWHRYYLTYLDDTADLWDGAAVTLQFGDEDNFDRLFADADSLSRREDALAVWFEEVQ